MNEMVWRQIFATKICESEIPDQWDLSVDMNLQKQDKGMKFAQYTFGSFRCSMCKRSWISSKVFVWFVENLDKRRRRGTVRMRIFKQGCENCNHFEGNPTITSDNITKVLSNLVRQIQKKFYEVNDHRKDMKPNTYGKLDGPHNRELCEACRYGLCEEQMSSHESPESKLDGPHNRELFQASRYGLYEEQMSSHESKEQQQESASGGILAALAAGVGALAIAYFASDYLENKNKKKP